MQGPEGLPVVGGPCMELPTTGRVLSKAQLGVSCVTMRSVGQFAAVLLLVGFVGAYFWQIVTVLAAVAIVWWLHREWPEYQARVAARRAELEGFAARADQQHTWVMAGDERGTYGNYQPTDIGGE